MFPLKRKGLLLFFLITSLILACRVIGLPGANTPAPAPSASPSPLPLASVTPSPTLIVFTPMPLTPSPEPHVYVVRKGDTISTIAYGIGLKVEDILAANPGLDAQFITPGQQIVIPALVGGKPVLPQPTLVPVRLDMPECYPSADGGLWCVSSAYNGSGDFVEGLRVLFTLHAVDGSPLQSLPAIPPLERLAPGKTLPLIIFFPPPVNDVKGVSLDLLSALAGRTAAARFVDVAIQVDEVRVEEAGKRAIVKGQLAVSGRDLRAKSIKIAATGYDQNGRVMGVKIWENAEALANNKPQVFTLTVYSLGRPVEHVDVQGEAKP